MAAGLTPEQVGTTNGRAATALLAALAAAEMSEERGRLYARLNRLTEWLTPAQVDSLTKTMDKATSVEELQRVLTLLTLAAPRVTPETAASVCKRGVDKLVTAWEKEPGGRELADDRTATLTALAVVMTRTAKLLPAEQAPAAYRKAAEVQVVALVKAGDRTREREEETLARLATVCEPLPPADVTALLRAALDKLKESPDQFQLGLHQIVGRLPAVNAVDLVLTLFDEAKDTRERSRLAGLVARALAWEPRPTQFSGGTQPPLLLSTRAGMGSMFHAPHSPQ